MPSPKDLKYEQDDNYLFGEIKMCLDRRRQKNLAVVVESKSDEKFYKKFFNRNTSFFSSSGWEMALRLVEMAKKQALEFVIAIIDADFKPFLDWSLPDQVFLTNAHDAEMMQLQSPSCWENLLAEYADDEKLAKFCGDGANLLNVLQEKLWPLSYLRYLNEQNGWGLKFKSIKNSKLGLLSFKDFFKEQDLSFSLPKLLRAVENKSKKPRFFKQNPEIEEEIATTTAANELEKWTNGHEFLELFSFALRRCIANSGSGKKIAAEDLERNLRISYRAEDFRTTALYQAITAWEDEFIGETFLLRG
ncbi:hypothetical protein SapgrDRAFT_2890 [Saprospira grandis DSM 2844]|uniref:DUF4435 domain-containing protein n=1 Tax=Saprospira grandis DSM 2844 TaxID=694433 RepID=J0P3W7_9BACT|nr:DUF4435 domain-containing protein [Saprospira grandis]EJF54544.1 hypothetical protein SapgrDRAFT_2890 [Saprospira grandis DSM 2844]